MEVSYRKDLRNNYLVIAKEAGCNDEDYCLRMLQANTIPGIIRPDLRIIDNQIFYYFDITSKQSLEIIYEKTPITYEQIRSFFLNVVEITDHAYEYLLNENNLVLDPKYIYTDLLSEKIFTCYLPGYNKDIRKQLINLIEFIMNKVDYKDNGAVLYIYNLYAVCREDGFSYDKFLLQIKDNKKDSLIKPMIRKDRPGENKTDEPDNYKSDINKPPATVKPENLPENKKPNRQIPVMEEKISEDQEKYYYPLKTYIYTGLCCLGAVFIFIIGIKTKLIYTSLGTRIDYGKLMFLILILFVVTGYLIMKIWDKKNRMTKVVRKVEYVDPRFYKDSIDEDAPVCQPFRSNYSLKGIEPSSLNKVNEYVNPTVLLNADLPASGCRLEPMEEDKYDVIRITEFPFIIGKQKGYVDYCLDKEVVSRYHLKIFKEENKYYIMDLNSTNGTCLNKIPLPCYQRTELEDGDEVEIAGIKYIFHKF